MTDMLTHESAPSRTEPTPGDQWAEPPWGDEVDEPLVCTERISVTHDVTSFVLAPRRPRWFSFQPGQHLTFTVEIHGEQIERCYTISSPPTRPDQLAITVKRVPGGPVSNWLHDCLAVGDSLPARGPYGSFTTVEHPAEKYLFLSAGSGITPLMSMTRTIADLQNPVDVVFVHNARTPDDIIFAAELDSLAADHPRINVVTICEDDSATRPWRGPRGRLSSSLLHRVAPDIVEREVFTCGPQPYMAAVRTMLADAGVDPQHCHEESFNLETPRLGSATENAGTPSAERPDTGAEQRYTVEFRRSGRTVDCDADTTVLRAAARAGLTLPSSCEEGMCGTCKTSLLDGTVQMNHNGGIRPREIRENKVLLCCSNPLEDLVVDA